MKRVQRLLSPQQVLGWAFVIVAALAPKWGGASAQQIQPPGIAEQQGQGVVQAGCSSCSNGLLASGPSMPPMGSLDGVPVPMADTEVGGSCGGCGGGCGEGGCFPGRKPCAHCLDPDCGGCVRFLGALHDCICCPDPCYEPHWIPAASAAFFVDGARPVTQTMLRYDYGYDMLTPDRSEYFWAQSGTKGPKNIEQRLNYNQFSIYTEAATERFSIFVNTPFRYVDPQNNPTAAGLSDISIGTKSLLLDCELIQATFQFVTTLPSGSFQKGLGNGLVSLEPSLLLAVKLYTDTYFQSQISEWLPIAGDQGYDGAILHYHFSLNHVLTRPIEDTELIGTLESGGYSFQAGAYSDPILGTFQRSSGTTYLYAGPGIRLSICNKIDFGIGVNFALTNEHFADTIYRAEFRWRF